MGLLFETTARQARSIAITTVVPPNESRDNPRFPCIESILGANNVHDCWVTIFDQDGSEHRFLVSCQKRRANCEVNRALRPEFPGIQWRGDITVMRGGTRTSVTNLIGAVSKHLALAAVCMCV